MASTSQKAGRYLAKGLGIKLDYRHELGKEDLSRGESIYSVSSAGTFVEDEPGSWEWFWAVLPSPRQMAQYGHNLFPFTHWITRYNVQWLIGDLIAGITVGAVVVPQSMAYALLAALPPEFGLYSSFMGVLIYWFFATSKDITIGPVAVMSTLVGKVVLKAEETLPDVPGDIVASALAIIAGAIIVFIGLIRCGWIVDFISLTAISAFMTGSAINIAAGQVPALMGISGFSTRESTYKVIINTLKYLPDTKLDAAMGLTALTMLYLIRSACSFGTKKVPSQKRLFFYLSTLRTVFVILLYTMISWLANRNHRSKEERLFKLLGDVPRGFKHARVPTITKDIIKAFASDLPATVIVLLIEHIAISKSFGRVNNYTIDPSQELVAIGVTNLLGPMLGAYPATGSFSRTAIKSKAGVRTPFAGVITAIVVLLAIYALPSVFFYIPSAGLSAVIIHAVGDLITPPNTVYQFWRVSPFEVIIFFVGVFVTIFTNIENGIYATIIISAFILLFRVVKARGRFLGKVKIHSVVGDHHVDESKGGSRGFPRSKEDPDSGVRNLFLPIDHHDGSNPEVEVDTPYPGIFIYRFSEGFNYPNANHYLDHLTTTIFAKTRRTNPDSFPRPGDRPWNNPGPRPGHKIEVHEELPTLKAIVLDFSSVNHVDVTAIQNLIDVRNQLDRWASPDRVDWHIACITNRWTKRALVSAGFGYPSPTDDAGFARWKPIFSVAEIGGHDSAAADAEFQEQKKEQRRRESQVAALNSKDDPTNVRVDDGIGRHSDSSSSSVLGKKIYSKETKVAVVHGLNRPLFHIDLTSALQSAITNIEFKKELAAAGGGKDIGVEP
ncbi:MAG: Sulfate permease 2 [Sclerophora amabilis]|nr:MAG: Sulfate permease 2 [Sclerophora amabilis]